MRAPVRLEANIRPLGTCKMTKPSSCMEAVAPGFNLILPLQVWSAMSSVSPPPRIELWSHFLPRTTLDGGVIR